MSSVYHNAFVDAYQEPIKSAKIDSLQFIHARYIFLFEKITRKKFKLPETEVKTAGNPLFLSNSLCIEQHKST